MSRWFQKAYVEFTLYYIDVRLKIFEIQRKYSKATEITFEGPCQSHDLQNFSYTECNSFVYFKFNISYKDAITLDCILFLLHAVSGI